MKPILFNTEMVRGVRACTKTVTRRIVKPQPKYAAMTQAGLLTSDNPIALKNGIVITASGSVTTWDKLPYRPGDILYVREAFCRFNTDHIIDGARYAYKADATPESERVRKEFGYKWRPSIHMPKEAARLFLRVMNVRTERVQDITDAEAQKEGAVDREDFRRVWNDCYSNPRPVKGEDGKIDHYESYPWEDIWETRTHRGKPWYVIGNPWVWVVEFKQILKEETETVKK